jgi:hypothetical protein
MLAWLKETSTRWNMYVANRVSKIEDLTATHEWLHVLSEGNPVDVLSRGTIPKDLCDNRLWWNGPSWLVEEESLWPNIIVIMEDDPECRRATICSAISTPQQEFSRFSTLPHLQQVTAYCLQFFYNTKLSKERIIGPLMALELFIEQSDHPKEFHSQRNRKI